MSTPPTLDEIKAWPAVVTVAEAARAIGVSRSHLYELIRTDDAPIRTLVFGNRRVVVTASIVDLLS